jgi:hypothetical protein
MYFYAPIVRNASLFRTVPYTGTTPFPASFSETLSLTEDAPHHLIIALPSCTLRAFPLRHVFVTRHTVRPPPTIQCPPHLRHLIRRF